MRGLGVCLVVLACLWACADAKGRLFEKPIAFPDQLVSQQAQVSRDSLQVAVVQSAAYAVVCNVPCPSQQRLWAAK